MGNYLQVDCLSLEKPTTGWEDRVLQRAHVIPSYRSKPPCSSTSPTSHAANQAESLHDSLPGLTTQQRSFFFFFFFHDLSHAHLHLCGSCPVPTVVHQTTNSARAMLHLLRKRARTHQVALKVALFPFVPLFSGLNGVEAPSFCRRTAQRIFSLSIGISLPSLAKGFTPLLFGIQQYQ